MSRSKIVFCLAAALALVSVAKLSNAETLQTLTSFKTGNGGPVGSSGGGLIVDGSTIYGVTDAGGANFTGAVFSLPVTGGTPTELGSFASDRSNGGNPIGDLTLSGSALYGAAQNGGGSPGIGDGAVYGVPVTGGTPTVLASFDGTDGAGPSSNLILSGGMLYGIAPGNGTGNGEGTVYSVPVAGGTPTVLASLSGLGNGLTLVGSTLYGVTSEEIFSVPITGGTPQVIATFSAAVGERPVGGVTVSADGSTLYGMTSEEGPLAPGNGPGGDGTIFSVPITGGTPTVLWAFTGGADGDDPRGSLVLNGSSLYGETAAGGANNLGTIFSIPTTGGTPTQLWTFTGGADGSSPETGLTLSGSTLYGMATAGGAFGDGTVFALATPEPSSLVLSGFGALALGAIVLRRKRRRHVGQAAA